MPKSPSDRNPTGKGGFTKGHKIYPGTGKRKPAPPEFKILLSAAVVPALQTLIKFANGEIKVGNNIRQRACEYIIDRQLGKPVTAISGVDGSAIVVNFSQQDNKL